jgi:hypothetical protein
MTAWRIHLHWTAGAKGIIPLEADSYNFLIDSEGCANVGSHPPEAQTPENIRKGSKFYAAHTLNANSYAIGVALDAMAGAQERPFRAGTNPITGAQLAGAVKFVAMLAKKYKIPVERGRILSHAEVQPTLGIKQNQKWDITWLPGMTAVGDAVVIGDQIREMVRKELRSCSGI